MTIWRVLGLVAAVPIVLIALGVFAVLGMRYYDANVFPQLRPERALKALFVNPDKAQVIKSEQHGAFKIGRVIHGATGVVRGKELQLQYYMQLSSGRIRHVFEGENICAEMLKLPDSELKFYDSSSNTPSAIDSYVVQQPSTNTFCFTHTEY